MEEKTLIETMRDFIKTCPFLGEYERFGINFLSNNTRSFSVEEIPSETIIKTYLDGGSNRKLDFVLASMFDYSEELQNSIENSGFYQRFSDWLEEKTNNDELPDLGNKKTAIKISAVNSGCLINMASGMKEARYEINCRLEYYKEA